MKRTTLKFEQFLTENGISEYFLHKNIKEKIRSIRNQMAMYEPSISGEGIHKTHLKDLQDRDAKLLASIENYLMQRIQKKTNNDVEILIAMKRSKWTRKIGEPELRKMGLEASLFWNTTILGKLKLVRKDDHVPIYYIIPIGEELELNLKKAKKQKLKNNKKTLLAKAA